MNKERYQLVEGLYSECLERAMLQEEHRGENYIDFRIKVVMEMSKWLEEQEEIHGCNTGSKSHEGDFFTGPFRGDVSQTEPNRRKFGNE